MTSERTQAYGRVLRTLQDVGPTKLHDAEQARIRDAADTLIFAATLDEARAPSRTSRRSPSSSSSRAAGPRSAPPSSRTTCWPAGRSRPSGSRPARAGSPASMADAVVIGAGPNGLVAANLLADAGWEVLVLEAQPEPGGAVRTAPLTLPGFTHDRFSAFYPLAVALAAHAPAAARGARAALARARPSSSPTRCATAAPRSSPATSRRRAPRVDAVRARRRRRVARALRLVGRASARASCARCWTRSRRCAAARGCCGALGGPRGVLDFARFGLLSVRRFAEERFRGDAAARLLAGNALHADLGPDTPGGALFGWCWSGSGRSSAGRCPRAARARLTDALVARLRSRGGRVECGARVERVLVRGGRAVGVRCGDGREAEARRAVLADTGAPQLYLELLEREHVPARVLDHMRRRFQYDLGTVKVDWALDGPIPWAAPGVDARRHGARDRRHGRAHRAGRRARARAGSPRGRS